MYSSKKEKAVVCKIAIAYERNLDKRIKQGGCIIMSGKIF